MGNRKGLPLQNMDQQQKRRRSIRIPHFDYSQPGYYFVTICTEDREELFGTIRNGIICISDLGAILWNEWFDLLQRFSSVELDSFIVMPNHIHGIIGIVGAEFTPAQFNAENKLNRQSTRDGADTRPAPTLGDIISTFKSLSFRRWRTFVIKNDIQNVALKFWQRNYFEHIIRNEQSLGRIREYIQNNPLKWELDIENQKCMNPDKKYYEKIFGE